MLSACLLCESEYCLCYLKNSIINSQADMSSSLTTVYTHFVSCLQDSFNYYKQWSRVPSPPSPTISRRTNSSWRQSLTRSLTLKRRPTKMVVYRVVLLDQENFQVEIPVGQIVSGICWHIASRLRYR